jgi:ATP-dependent Clp protease protease subunit
MMGWPPELQTDLLGRRVVFLRGRLDSANANNVIGQLLLVAATSASASRTVELYIDSPGGSLSAALAVYDVLQTLGAPVSTTCIGTAAGAAVLVLAAGGSGVRFALPHARVHLVEDPVDVAAGSVGNVARQAEETARVRASWVTALARYAACSVEQLTSDLAAGKWLNAAEAQAYGLLDAVVARGAGG